VIVTVRGEILDVGESRDVETGGGTRELVEMTLALDGPTAVTLWGSWTETADHAEAGMDLLVTDPDQGEFRGERTYATTGDSRVVLEPDYLVDVTDVRSWVQCPRMYYLNKIGGVPLAEPVTKGTVVHEVFGDLLRGRDLDEAVDARVAEAGLELGLLGEDPDAVTEDVRQHAGAIEGWLAQGALVEDDWRSEQTLISPTFGMKGRADAVRRGSPVELKTGKNTKRDPRFHDKVQAACYALLLGDRRDGPPDTGTLLYTKNAAVDRSESGDLSPAKDFAVGDGLLNYIVRERNALVGTQVRGDVPTGYEADATCEYCFEQDTCMAVSGRLAQESKAGAVGEPLPDSERAYFEQWYDRIEAERRAVHGEYAKLWEQTPEERADADRAVVDLEPAGQEPVEGGRWRLAAERPAPVASKIREGDRVLASDGDPVGGDAELATVERLTAEDVVVTADEPVELRRLDVYPSELSVDRMLTALHDTVLRGDPGRKAVLFGDREPEFDAGGVTSDAPFVENNEAQNRAVERALAAEEFALVHGPPGTGKTYTIAALVRELVARGERVLLSAFTNRAVDNCVAALREQGVADVLRMGTETGVREDMRDLRLDRSLPAAEQADRLTSAPVVAATTATCGSRTMREQSFDAAVVDEATQLTEPDTLAAVDLADRFVLVGDHRQLPPVVRAEEMDESLFERLIEEYPDAAVLLDRQYRMGQRIQAFPSAEFYEGALRPANAEVAGRSPAEFGMDADPVEFVHVAGDSAEHTDSAEAERVAREAERFVDAGVDPADIGVIAPFRAQVAEVGRRVPAGVTVDTVDRFQGSSQEVILVSFVATGSLDGPIFEDYRRLNVALTRAKRALVLVGDRSALETDPVYRRMVAWAEKG
jgi:DNA replication ATP-dependent helicase Dna2